MRVAPFLGLLGISTKSSYILFLGQALWALEGCSPREIWASWLPLCWKGQAMTLTCSLPQALHEW